MKNQDKTLFVFPFLIAAIISLLSFTGQAQQRQVFFSEDFNNAEDWNLGYKVRDGYHTTWRINTVCSISGKSLGVQLWDTTSKTWSCGYDEFLDNNTGIIASKSINGSSYRDMKISFDWKAKGTQYNNQFYDYGQLGYSLDNGLTYTWLDYGGVAGADHAGYYASPSGVPTNPVHEFFGLPEELNGREFQLAFKWVNDDFTVATPGLFVDNITISGYPDWNVLSVIYEDDFSSNKGWELGKSSPGWNGRQRTIWNITSFCDLDQGKVLTINRHNENSGNGPPYYCGYYRSLDVSNGIIAQQKIDASGMDNIQLLFDWSAGGEGNDTSALDYGEVGYSTDNGQTFTWINHGGYNNSGKYYYQWLTLKQDVIHLPNALNDKAFILGFRWINDGSHGVYTNGFTIDNVRILGKPRKGEAGSVQKIVFQSDALPQINRIRVDVPRTKEVLYESNLDIPNPNTIKTVSKYFDGLGRPIQTVDRYGSPNYLDMVGVTTYDVYGRVTESFLPYPDDAENGDHKLNALDNQLKFYQTQPEDHVNSIDPYATTIYEYSALSRVKKQGFQGETWQPRNFSDRSVKTSRKLNVATDNVRDFYYDSQTETIKEGSNYVVNKLFKNIRKDENDHQTIDFKDSRGKVVLNRKFEGTTQVNTYYVYDEFQRLRAVIQPNAVVNSIPLTSELIEQYVFQYGYDARGRLEWKKIPGSNIVYMAYDEWDRLAATQDGNQRNKPVQEFSFIKYDGLNRPVMTGVYKNNASTNITTIRNALVGGGLERAEIPSNQDPILKDYTTTRTWPFVYHSNPEAILTKTFYDRYDFFSLNNYPFVAELGHSSYDDATLGRETGSWAKILETSKTIINSNFFDEYGRPIQTNGNNSSEENNTQGTIRATNKYSIYDDLVEETRETVLFKKTGTDYSQYITRFYEHDHRGRLLKTSMKIGDGATQVLSEHTYNALGQLLKKKLHKAPTTNNYLEEINYKYNIRGWLTQMNDPEDHTSTDLFSLKLAYHKLLVGVGVSDQYNGNIAQMSWKVNNQITNKHVERKYYLGYDGINRLKEANYQHYDIVAESNKFNWFNTTYTYDDNGNINNLTRKGKRVTGNYSTVDNLTYYYLGNQLKAVNDGVDDSNDVNTFKEPGAHNGSLTNPEFIYDQNGNAVSDDNKGINNIVYNHLNLPRSIGFNNQKSIEHIYDATGRKLEKNLYIGGIIGVTRISKLNYIGSFEFLDDELSFIHTDEGRVVLLQNGSVDYQYSLKDHLGNVRVVFKKDESSFASRIIQENHYYPFGSKFGGADHNFQSGLENNYLYNGKEFEDFSGFNQYDYGARHLDPLLGRWFVVDPLADVMPSWSPYTFVFNNPINFIDPDGRIPYPITIRSFAPFNYFGGGFHGDGSNRGFTTSSTATARVHQTINFDTDKTQLKTNVWSSPSSHRFLPGTITGSPTVSIDNFSIANNGDSKRFDFGTHSKGSNPFIPGSPNIDVFSNFSITESDGLLNVSGDLKGDNFPSTEAFITDPNGNNVFIGVGFYEGSPFSSLDGENKRDITSFSFGIQTDKKGNFTGVQYNGADYSIGDWNKLFEQTDPHKDE